MITGILNNLFTKQRSIYLGDKRKTCKGKQPFLWSWIPNYAIIVLINQSYQTPIPALCSPYYQYLITKIIIWLWYCNAPNPHRVRTVITINFWKKRIEFPLKLDYTPAYSLTKFDLQELQTIYIHISITQQPHAGVTTQRVTHPEYTLKHTSMCIITLQVSLQLTST